MLFRSEIHGLLPKYEIRPLKDFVQLMTSSNLPGLKPFINVMIGLAVAIGFLVIFLSMYTTVIERTKEIGVLKSLGASKAYIVEIVMSETALLCAFGAVAGIALSFTAQAILLKLFPALTILMTGKWLAIASAIALVSGLMGAAYPAWMASRKDPVDALAYE